MFLRNSLEFRLLHPYVEVKSIFLTLDKNFEVQMIYEVILVGISGVKFYFFSIYIIKFGIGDSKIMA